MGSSVFVTNFGTIDWIIVIAYVGFTVARGVWVNRYIGDLSDFIVAGRSLRTYLAVATMTGTEIGLVTLVYSAEQGFLMGPSAYTLGLTWFIGLLIVGTSGFIIYPLRKLSIMTIPEYYEIRYGIRARVVGGVILALAGILNMGLFLQAGARFMRAMLGVGSDVGMKVIMTAMLALVLLYTTFGGMVSVVVTDYIQFVVLGIAMVVATVWAVTHIGWDQLVSTSVAQYGDGALNPIHEGGYGWPYVLWMVYMAVASSALWATATTRALSAKSPETAKRVYQWSSITFLSRIVIPVTWGAAALAFIMGDDILRVAFFPAEGGSPLNSQYAMPVFFARLLPSGFIGVLTAGMMAGFMSTHDSYLLCWASVITQDVVAPLYRVGERGKLIAAVVAAVVGGLGIMGVIYGLLSFTPLDPLVIAPFALIVGIVSALFIVSLVPKALQADDLPERSRFILTRVLIVAIGIFLLIWGLWYEAPVSLWNYMAVTGTIYFAGAFACIAFGLYWRRATEPGALFALIAGLIAVAGIIPWESILGEGNVPSWLNDTYASIAAIAVASVGMVVISLVTRGRPAHKTAGLAGTILSESEWDTEEGEPAERQADAEEAT